MDLAEKILRAAFDTRAKAGEKRAPVMAEVPQQPPEPTTDEQVAEAKGEDLPRAEDAKVQTPPKAKARNSAPRNAKFRLDLSLPVSIGLEEENARRLLGSAGFRVQRARALAEGAFGPEAPDSWTWRPRHADERRSGNRRKGRPQQKARKGQRGDAKPHAKGGGKDRGKPHTAKPGRGGKSNHAKNQRPKPDFGPARAGGAFDKLADLLGK